MEGWRERERERESMGRWDRSKAKLVCRGRRDSHISQPPSVMIELSVVLNKELRVMIVL